MQTMTDQTFSSILDRAVSEPGLISRAYSAFYGYSIGNQLFAWVQCLARGIEPGPIATFMGWKSKGRSVRKGEKAIALCMPITCKRRAEQNDQNDAQADNTAATFTRFIFRNNWFVLAQTEGAAVEPIALDAWDPTRALAALNVTEEAFALLDGNTQGYAHGRAIAISPVAAHPHKTRFHELAHVVLGHTTEAADDRTPQAVREVEAEAVALVCLEALGLPGAEFCRGYIQNWNAARANDAIPERSAQKIFKAADTILRAGRETAADNAANAA